MGIIFTASTEVGSSAHSGRLLRPLLTWLGLGEWLYPARFELVNHYVRKAGHVTEYALLGGLLHRAVVSSGRRKTAWRERWAPTLVLAVLGAVALYAASDEFHQVFVATRTPSIWDVMLDFVGGVVGLGIKWAWERRRRQQSG
jgi:VanZ family protein